MPNRETTSDQAHVPFHSCIRLEDVGQARTSSIDAEWDTLSFAVIPERTLPTVSARPRFETLPGLGPESEPAIAPRRSHRPVLLVSMLAAALAIGFSFVAAVVERNSPILFAPPTLAPPVVTKSEQSNLPALTSEPPPRTSDTAPPLPSARVAPAQAPALASKVEPPLAKVARNSRAMPRAILSTARVASEIPEPRFSSVNNHRAGQALASTDNPY
ncbi:MAG TPA: hypothetical protein VER11_23445 [Polyangiaceae bacterium]|nr:hypothetical protein [Polyangiaceae bacterium]